MYTSKVMDTCYVRNIMDDAQIEKQLSNAWRKDKCLTPSCPTPQVLTKTI